MPDADLFALLIGINSMAGDFLAEMWFFVGRKSSVYNFLFMPIFRLFLFVVARELLFGQFQRSYSNCW